MTRGTTNDSDRVLRDSGAQEYVACVGRSTGVCLVSLGWPCARWVLFAGAEQQYRRCEERLEVMNAVVEQERTDRESRDTMHKNELQLVEELINGRQDVTHGVGSLALAIFYCAACTCQRRQIYHSSTRATFQCRPAPIYW